MVNVKGPSPFPEEQRVTPDQVKDEGAILIASGTRLRKGALRARTILEDGRCLEADAPWSLDELLRLIPVTARP
jgi:hypothetical protein